MKILSKEQRAEYLTKIRKKMKERKGGGFRKDPFEYRVPKTKDGEEINLYLRVLPELSKGETCEGGMSTRDYEFYFYLQGAHWINNKKYECPRLHDDAECPICDLAFELFNETSEEGERKEIARKYLPRTYYAVNVYFLDNEKNPQELRGKVLWMSIPKTIYDLFDACLHSDDPGDEDDQKAFGFFYDVTEGYVFKLLAKRRGDYNNYEASKFLPKTLGPLVKTEEGAMDEKGIQQLLDQRHDLVTKFTARDVDLLKSVVKKLVSGDDDDDVLEKPRQTSAESPPKKENRKIDSDDIEDKPKSGSKKDAGAASSDTKDEDLKQLLDSIADDD